MAGSITPKENNGHPIQSDDIFAAMRAEMERVFDRFVGGWPSSHITFGETGVKMPSVDVKDTGQALVIEAELPGVDEKDVSVTVHDGTLTLKGEKRQNKEEKGESRYVMERSFGSFMRTIPLPEGIDEDKITARFEKGVLTITAEKGANPARPEKKIEIKNA